MQILRAADRVATPWKNGGGVTREVAIWPPSADLDNFDWRVSIADVREAGPFSVFENIDRVMLILNGQLALAFADRVVELDTQSAPFAFPGDVACAGSPRGGDVMDLNVMTRRGRSSARVVRLPQQVQRGGANRCLIVATESSAVDVAGNSIALNPLDAIFIEGDAAMRLRSGAGFMIALSGD